MLRRGLRLLPEIQVQRHRRDLRHRLRHPQGRQAGAGEDRRRHRPLPPGAQRQPDAAFPDAVVAGEHARRGRAARRGLRAQALQDPHPGGVGLHRARIRVRRLRGHGPGDGTRDRARPQPLRVRAGHRGDVRPCAPRTGRQELHLPLALRPRYLRDRRHVPPDPHPFRRGHRARARNESPDDPGLPHQPGPRRGGELRSRHLQRRHLVRPHRQGLARRQGARPRVPEPHPAEIRPLRQVGGRAGAGAAHPGDHHRILRPFHPGERSQIRHQLRPDGRRDPLGIRGLHAPAGAHGRAAHLRAPRPQAARGPLVVEAGRFLLSAVCRGLFDLYDPAHGERRPAAPPALQGHQERLCVRVFRLFQRLHHGHGQRPLRGEDGHRAAGDLRLRGPGLLLPDHLGRGPFGQLLPAGL